MRDLAICDLTSGTTSVVNHLTYTAFGQLLSQTNPATGNTAAVDCLFGFTGRAFDPNTGLQNNGRRWYNASLGRWESPDPDGFTAGDTNLYRYCGNSPTDETDPTGLAPSGAGEDWKRLEEILRDWTTKTGVAFREYFAVHHIFHEEWYVPGNKLGEFLTKLGFPRDSFANLIPLPKQAAINAGLAGRRTMHLGGHSPEKGLENFLRGIMEDVKSNQLAPETAERLIREMQVEQRMALREGTVVLHHEGTLERSFAKAARFRATPSLAGASDEVVAYEARSLLPELEAANVGRGVGGIAGGFGTVGAYSNLAGVVLLEVLDLISRYQEAMRHAELVAGIERSSQMRNERDWDAWEQSRIRSSAEWRAENTLSALLNRLRMRQEILDANLEIEKKQIAEIARFERDYGRQDSMQRDLDATRESIRVLRARIIELQEEIRGAATKSQ